MFQISTTANVASRSLLWVTFEQGVPRHLYMNATRTYQPKLPNHFMSLSTVLYLLVWMSTVYLSRMANYSTSGRLASRHTGKSCFTSSKAGSDGACWIWVRYCNQLWGLYSSHCRLLPQRCSILKERLIKRLATAVPFLEHPTRAGVFFRITLWWRVGLLICHPWRKGLKIDRGSW